MKTYIAIVLALLVNTLAHSEPKTAEAIKAEEIKHMAYQAYVFATPIHEFHRAISAIDMALGRKLRPLNRMVHSPIMTPAGGKKGLCCPSQDTIYSVAQLDLRAEPIIISIPRINDRYYSLQFSNSFTINMAHIGIRQIGEGDQDIVLVGPEWDQPTPEGMQVIRYDTNDGLVGLRLLLKNQQDYPALRNIQKQVNLKPLSRYLDPSLKVQETRHMRMAQHWQDDHLETLRWLNHYLAHNPMPAHDAGMRGMFEALGITGDPDFDPKMLPKQIQEGLSEGHILAEKMIVLRNKHRLDSTSKSAWRRAQDGKDQRYDNLLRASIVRYALLPSDKEEAIYFASNVDSRQSPLNGASSYTLHFDKAPPVDGFWSLTAYSAPDSRLIKNAYNKYVIRDRDPSLKFNDDGSLDLLMSSEKPASGIGNWLPIPKGDFVVAIRTYLPSQPIVDGNYEFPAILRSQ
jgi:hypothetical protein